VAWDHGIVGSSPTILISLGGVTDARRSDTAKVVVQFHPERLHRENVMEQELSGKRGHALIRGRGVTAAQQTFNLSGGGSNPSGPIDRRACSSTVRAGSV
jgi:hypothetical protein